MDPEIYRLLGEMKGKLDGIAERTERMEDKLDEQSGTLHSRISKVETAQARHLGIVAGAGSIIMLVWEVIRAKLQITV
jgi:hypothetical protein